MKLLLDNCVKKEATEFFPGHETSHVVDLGWGNFKNGELLRSASGRFDVLVTVDRSMRFQSSLRGLTLRVAVLEVRSNMIEDLRAGCDALLRRLDELEEGAFAVITLP